MAVRFGARQFGCGRFEAVGWDPACPELEQWLPSPTPVAGSDEEEHEDVEPVEVV